MVSKYFEINGDGHNIRCKIYESGKSAPGKVVIFSHGFAGHKDNKVAETFATKLISKHADAAVITFDLPCHGGDVKKKLRLEDCDTYLRMVLTYAKEKFGEAELYSYAVSFGAFLILNYIYEYENPFAKIALRSTAVPMYDTLTENLTDEDWTKLNKGKEIPKGFDRKVNVDKVFLDAVKEKDVRVRDYMEFADVILMLHGCKDEVVPVESAEKFSDDNVIELELFENGDHRFQNPQTLANAHKKIMEWYGLD